MCVEDPFSQIRSHMSILNSTSYTVGVMHLVDIKFGDLAANTDLVWQIGQDCH